MKMEQGEDSEEFYQELEEEQLAHFNKHLRGRRAARGRGNSQTDIMYKEALMDSIFGRFQEASKKLKLMITLAPDSPQPYHLLGTMHQQLGQFDKAAEYLFISTYLSPPNLQKWLKVGQLSYERRMFSQAAYCFGRALKIANCDPNIMLRRAQAFEMAGQSKKAIVTYRRLLNTANSPQFAKKYARLRFRRGEYSQCRQILQAQTNFKSNPNLVNMACQAYLKQRKYQNAAELLEEHLRERQNEITEGEELPAQFLIIMLICSVSLNRNCYEYSGQQLLNAAKQCYQQKFADLYSEAINHISSFNEEMGYQLVHFLLKYSSHQKISNYILATDFLCRRKQTQTCLDILEQALNKFPHYPELLAQQTYIHKCFGIKKHSRHPIEEDIFYSDDQDEQSYQQSEIIPHREVEVDDAQTIIKVLRNVRDTQKIMLGDLKQKMSNITGKTHEQFLESLNLFISLAPAGRQKGEQFQKQGLYQRRGRKRGDGEHKVNALYNSIELVLQYFEGLIEYMLCLLKQKQYKRMAQMGEKVSKVHVFKNQNKRGQFSVLKVRIYELSILGCLAIKKFNGALFFMRYLAARHPSDKLYLLSLHLLLRFCKKKTFLSSALSKQMDNPQGYHLARILAIQYMETGCFDLAVNAFLKLGNNESKLGLTPQLCLSACLLQIASSRNTYNKLDFTNRSALCFANYQRQLGPCLQGMFNRGRWFAQVKLNHKAITCFEVVLESQCEISLKQRAAYCLMNIYKQIQQYEKCQELSKKFFSIKLSQEQVQ